MIYISHIISGQFNIIILFTYLTAVFFAFVENVFPQTSYPKKLLISHHRTKRWARNIGLYFINVLLSPLYKIIPLFIAAHLAIQNTFTNNPIYIVLGILLLDLSLYVDHWLDHHLPFFWAFHRVHHMDEFLDITSAFRFHMFETTRTTIVQSLIIILLGLSHLTVIVFLFIAHFILIYEHSNIRINRKLEKLIGLMFITPEMHWVHHNATLPQTNTNYGVIFSFWDRLFGTLSATIRSDKIIIGLSHIPDQSIFKLIIFPFVKVRSKALFKSKA